VVFVIIMNSFSDSESSDLGLWFTITALSLCGWAVVFWFFRLPDEPVKVNVQKTICDYSLCFEQPWLPITPLSDAERLNNHVLKLRNFANEKKWKPDYFILIDMHKPSGQNRLFLYDFNQEQIIDKGLVTHGTGSFFNEYKLIFSNVPGSNCTSLGKYKIGKKYYGEWGLSYKLLGLDSTNNNAMIRNIVLHSMPCVPDKETHPDWICNSYGCPGVSPAMISKIDALFSASDSENLLWIYE